MDSTPEPTKQELCELAYAVGQLVADVGDFYDIAANVAIGYRDATIATADRDSPPAAYTGSSQIPRVGVVAVEPNFIADQESRYRVSKDHWNAVLVSLGALQSAIDSTIASSVGDARADGVTWEEIGDALGLTKQGAHKRYGSPVVILSE